MNILMSIGFLDGRCMASGGAWRTASSIAENPLHLLLFMGSIFILAFMALTSVTGGVTKVLEKRKMRWDRSEGGME